MIHLLNSLFPNHYSLTFPFLLKIKKTTKVDYVREPGDRLSNANIEKKYFKNLEV